MGKAISCPQHYANIYFGLYYPCVYSQFTGVKWESVLLMWSSFTPIFFLFFLFIYSKLHPLKDGEGGKKRDRVRAVTSLAEIISLRQTSAGLQQKTKSSKKEKKKKRINFTAKKIKKTWNALCTHTHTCTHRGTSVWIQSGWLPVLPSLYAIWLVLVSLTSAPCRLSLAAFDYLAVAVPSPSCHRSWQIIIKMTLSQCELLSHGQGSWRARAHTHTQGVRNTHGRVSSCKNTHGHHTVLTAGWG